MKEFQIYIKDRIEPFTVIADECHYSKLTAKDHLDELWFENPKYPKLFYINPANVIAIVVTKEVD